MQLIGRLIILYSIIRRIKMIHEHSVFPLCEIYITLFIQFPSRFQQIRQTLFKFSFSQRDPEERRIPRRTLRIRREDFPLNGTLIDCCG